MIGGAECRRFLTLSAVEAGRSPAPDYGAARPRVVWRPTGGWCSQVSIVPCATSYGQSGARQVKRRANITRSPEEVAAHVIAVRSQELKVLFLGISLLTPALLHPARPGLDWLLDLNGVPRGGDLPFDLKHHPGDAEALVFSAKEVFAAAAALRGEIVAKDLLALTMSHGAIRLGDMIQVAGLRDSSSPLLEFARHFRNACAHGDRWHFRGQEPIYRAACREVVLSRQLYGQRATFVTISPRLYIEFLDDLAAHFAER